MVRATLKGGGILDFKLVNWTEGKLEVESPIFGKAALNGAMIDSVTFNADDKRNKSGQTLTKKELKKLQREKEKGAFDRLNPAPPIPKLEK
jgi:hypothetical protein